MAFDRARIRNDHSLALAMNFEESRDVTGETKWLGMAGVARNTASEAALIEAQPLARPPIRFLVQMSN